jgi:AraC-like DNA-binding protein
VGERYIELPVSVPGLHAIRGMTASRHTGIKEHYGVGRIEDGDTEWWGRGRVWRSVAGSVLLKQPGDVVRHLAHRGVTTYVAVTLPAAEVVAVLGEGQGVAIAQLEPTDPRSAPFHRLLNAVNARANRLALEVAVAEAISALANVAGPRSGSECSRPVGRALEYLRARLDDPITLADLAKHAELDKFRLCRAFRAQIGMPPHRYLTHLRIARAKELLRDGVRASDLAPLVGIYDQAQLTRHFRRLVGTTPAQYAKSPPHPKYRSVVGLSAQGRAVRQ